jgi:hypothetical protein
MVNVIALWLELIGTPARANKLLQQWQGDPALVLLEPRLHMQVVTTARL